MVDTSSPTNAAVQFATLCTLAGLWLFENTCSLCLRCMLHRMQKLLAVTSHKLMQLHNAGAYPTMEEVGGGGGLAVVPRHVPSSCAADMMLMTLYLIMAIMMVIRSHHVDHGDHVDHHHGDDRHDPAAFANTAHRSTSPVSLHMNACGAQLRHYFRSMRF